MRYMIRSVPSRQWYVDDFLIPSMLQQGIGRDEIVVHCDTEGRGNLFSCIDSFLWCSQHTASGTWHLQDDIVISNDFAEKTKKYNNGVVCGFVCEPWGPDFRAVGLVPASSLWYSFQCIRVPDELAGEFVIWFYERAMKSRDLEYVNRIKRGKHDDDFFQFFLHEKHAGMSVTNLKPNIVDHIDYLIGGTLINDDRPSPINRAAYWEDEKIVRRLEDALYAYKIRKEADQNGS